MACQTSSLAYQFLFLQLLLFFSQSTATLCSHDQTSALLQFKQHFSIKYLSSYFHCEVSAIRSEVLGFQSPPYCDGRCPSYPKTVSWKEDIDCCLWDGVTCDTLKGHVIGLDLSCGWLHGNIPSNSTLFLLRHLQRLNLAFNDFSLSHISSDFSQLSSLTHLNLSNSYFTGKIPSEISHLSKMVSLDLSKSDYFSNYLTNESLFQENFGKVIIEISVLQDLVQNLTELTELFLDTVDMSTIISRSLSNLSSSLTSLSLNYCGLRGNFPDHIFRLPNLQILSLRGNFNLTGKFPNFNWSSPLKFLDASHMSLSGKLPNSIGNLMSLRHLRLHNCSLVGLIPTSLGNLTQLTYLRLSFNNFGGHFPSFLSNLVQLRILDLSYNNFIGEFPVMFAGSIPSRISGLQNLLVIYLSNNSLNGTIPSWLFNLPSLKYMSLRHNQLTGHIDEFQSNSLEIIGLGNNRLNGSIPSSLFVLVNLTALDLSLNNLSGIVELHMFAKFKNLEYLDLSYINISVSTAFIVNSSFSQLRWLGLSACNISKFLGILRSADQLEYLDLSNNKIHGPIPNWMWNIGKDTLFQLNLSHNFLTGIVHLPWKNLDILDLRYNLLQGPLPNPPPYLRYFLVSNNKLTGEIPYIICNMSVIEIVDLSHNSLTGNIPECMGNFSSLHVLDLQKNKFYGTIPRTFTKGNYLRTINFNENELEGPIPPSLINCSMLEVLDLGQNKINDTFPYWLGRLPKLKILVLSSNKFYGSIQNCSETNHYFHKLKIFDLSNNKFSGFLPVKYFEELNAMMDVGEVERKLQYMGDTYYEDSITVTMKGWLIELVKIITTSTIIDFSNNNFHGEIPEAIGKLTSLRLLNLSQNNLTSCIPSSLENLSALESLDLSSNKLVGRIPWQLARLNFLQVLRLSHNHLVGSIPRDSHLDTFSNDSYDGNFGLCGFPLSNACVFDDTPQPSSILEDDVESSNLFGWKVVLMGYGCGMVFGVFMGYLMFSTGKPQWLVRIVEGERP